MAQNRVRPITLVSIASSTLTTNYQPFNPAGLDGACFYLRINNLSSTTVTLSFDGVNDHEVVASSTALALNFQTNAQPMAWTALVPKGQIIYIKATAGTGTVYMSGYYVQASGG